MLKVLTPADRVAVNEASGTDASGGGSALPMQDVVDKAAIDRAINTMNPIDPLSNKPALTAAYNVLQHTNAKITHIIVLGDGEAEDSYYEAARASLARGGTGALRAYVQALPDIQQALHGSVPASGLATDLYEDEQQNACETRSHAQIMRDALAKVNWQEIAEALREE